MNLKNWMLTFALPSVAGQLITLVTGTEMTYVREYAFVSTSAIVDGTRIG